MKRRTITAAGAPKALGAYSHAVAAGALVFTAGQIPLDPATGKLVGGDIRAQARRAIQNVLAVLAADGLTAADVVKTTVFLTDLAQGSAVNEVYAEFFSGPGEAPARSTVGVAALPAGAGIEIEAIAVRSR